MIGTASGETSVEPLVHDSALDAGEHIAQPADVEQAGRGIGPRRLQQDVVGLVAAQHVVDEVGRDGDLPAGLLPARDGASRSGPEMTAQLRNVRFSR